MRRMLSVAQFLTLPGGKKEVVRARKKTDEHILRGKRKKSSDTLRTKEDQLAGRRNEPALFPPPKKKNPKTPNKKKKKKTPQSVPEKRENPASASHQVTWFPSVSSPKGKKKIGSGIRAVDGGGNTNRKKRREPAPIIPWSSRSWLEIFSEREEKKRTKSSVNRAEKMADDSRGRGGEPAAIARQLIDEKRAKLGRSFHSEQGEEEGRNHRSWLSKMGSDQG